jgi:ATP synthase protein I
LSNKTPEPEDLRALGARLDEMRRREAVKNQKPAPTSMGIAFRFATELVAALIVGGGIGWGLDYLFGTRPILLIVFFVLGAAAGIRNVMRAAQELNEQAAAATSTPSVADDDDEER